MKHVKAFLIGFVAALSVGWIPGPQGAVNPGALTGSTLTLSDGDSPTVNVVLTATRSIYNENQLVIDDGEGDSAQLFVNFIAYAKTAPVPWSATGNGFVHSADAGINWTNTNDAWNDLPAVAFFRPATDTVRLGKWDGSGANPSDFADDAVFSVAAIAPVDSAHTLVLREDDGTAALTIQTSGELKHGTVDWYSKSGEKALTDATATEVWRLSVPQGSGAGGTMALSIYATDGTDYQVHSEEVSWAAVNKAGTFSVEVSSTATIDADADSTGTLTCTFDMTEPVDDVVALRINANTSLTPTTLRVRYIVLSDTAGVTPQ